MLSEPRKKQRISVDPQNKQWAEDKTKFGYKMLTKLGWTDGKGLGKEENGSTSHIKVSRKTDNSGVGVKRSASVSNWIKHADAFSDLLSHLNEDTDDDTEKAKQSKTLPPNQVAVSSEDTSKKQYHRKTARSKDVRGYGKADLDAIFGRKGAVKEEMVTKVENWQFLPALPEKNPTTFLPTVVNKTSVSDYFKEKISALGLKLEIKSVVIEDTKAASKSDRKIKKLKDSEESGKKKRHKEIEKIKKGELKKPKLEKKSKIDIAIN